MMPAGLPPDEQLAFVHRYLFGTWGMRVAKVRLVPPSLLHTTKQMCRLYMCLSVECFYLQHGLRQVSY
jgi:hypothetical protein